MAIEDAYFEEVLQESLTERDKELQEKELPEINIGEAIPVSEGLDFAMEYFSTVAPRLWVPSWTVLLVTRPTL